jgi:hypothetical protein
MDKLCEIHANNCGLKITIKLHGPFEHYWDKLAVKLGRHCCIVKVMELRSSRTCRSPHEKGSEPLYFIKAGLEA